MASETVKAATVSQAGKCALQSSCLMQPHTPDDWSTCPLDILALIIRGGSLSFADKIAVSQTCRSWRLALVGPYSEVTSRRLSSLS